MNKEAEVTYDSSITKNKRLLKLAIMGLEVMQSYAIQSWCIMFLVGRYEKLYVDT